MYPLVHHNTELDPQQRNIRGLESIKGPGHYPVSTQYQIHRLTEAWDGNKGAGMSREVHGIETEKLLKLEKVVIKFKVLTRKYLGARMYDLIYER